MNTPLPNPDFEQRLDQYAKLIIRVGLNLQPGQRLIISEPFTNRGVNVEAAPLVRRLAEHAYRCGARFVDVMWSDEGVTRARFEHAPRDSFDEYPEWQATELAEAARRGDALLIVLSRDPRLLAAYDPALVSADQQATTRRLRAATELRVRGAINWCVAAGAVPSWARRVYPELPAEQQTARLWDAIFEMCRVTGGDALAAWEQHLAGLVARSAYLTDKQYAYLHLRAPGTDLRVGLPRGHVWQSARMRTTAGLAFTANMPTEEVFTLPHRADVAGHVTATKPFIHGGMTVEGLRLELAEGKVVGAWAEHGQDSLDRLLATDDGAGRLGEIALVPHSSPISRLDRLFHNVLIDENASVHLALGYAYPSSLEGGASLEAEAFNAAGGNTSAVHADFMVGSEHMDVDGVTEAGEAEAILRQGEWAWAP